MKINNDEDEKRIDDQNQQCRRWKREITIKMKNGKDEDENENEDQNHQRRI
jgi:hypothetical protein